MSIIIKSDVHGSSEAIKNAIEKIKHPEVSPKIILFYLGLNENAVPIDENNIKLYSDGHVINSEKAEVLGNAYTKAAASIEEISNISGSESNLGDQLEKVSGNLTQLNNLYEMQYMYLNFFCISIKMNDSNVSRTILINCKLYFRIFLG